MEQDYLTVGQFAREVGTTVRTIQYYDQLGLLSPSAKGPGNQRLYTDSDREDLYRILTLKYLGLPLAEIGEHADIADDPQAFREIVSHTMASLEEDFQNLLKRLSVLRTLSGATAQERIDWTQCARTIEAGQGEDKLFWHHLADDAPESSEERAAPRKRGMAFAQWHELIADAIELMANRVPADDPRAAELARRYQALEEAKEGSLADIFELAANFSPHGQDAGSFEALRSNVIQYLKEVRQANA